MKSVATSAMYITLSLLLVGTLGIGAAAAAALPGDANGDGAISCGEARQQTKERFCRLDTNKDGAMTMAEFDAGTRNNFDAMDSDKNGMVDVKEYVTYWCGTPPKDTKAPGKAAKKGKKSLHRKMDANTDGKVTTGECIAFWTVRFSDMDKSSDGSLTRDEFGNKMVEYYSQMDVNKDGSVTVTEYADYWVDKCSAEKLKKALSEQ